MPAPRRPAPGALGAGGGRGDRDAAQDTHDHAEEPEREEAHADHREAPVDEPRLGEREGALLKKTEVNIPLALVSKANLEPEFEFGKKAKGN